MSRSKLASRSARERRKANGVQYKRFTHAHNGSWHECFYCGMPADTVDHFPPVSRVHDYRSLGLLHETYVTVSSCKECNSILADSLQETLIDRVEALKNKLQKRLKKHLKMPEWFQDEVDEMGAVMRSFIAGQERQRELAQCRMDYYDGLNQWMLSLPSYLISQEWVDQSRL